LRFTVHDLREFSPDIARERIIAVFDMNHEKALILIGHGNSTGTTACGVDAEMLPNSADLEILWIYACNSAKRIASNLAKRGLTTFGFITDIIVPSRDLPSEIEQAQECVAPLEQVDSTDLYCRLRKKLFEFAKKSFQQGQILQAARVNHTRLSLRVFSPVEDCP